MKKYILKSLFVSMLCMLAASCQDTDEFAQLDSRKAQVMFSVAMDSQMARSRATWGDDYTPSLKGDVYDNHIELNQLVVKIEAGGNIYEVKDIVKWKDGEANKYKFVGVVENVTAAKELEDIKISVFANMGTDGSMTTFEQDAENIPMWGMTSMDKLTLAPGTRQDLETIHLLRAMAKMEVSLNAKMAGEYALTGVTLNKYNKVGNCLPTIKEGTKYTTELDQEAVMNVNASNPQTELAFVEVTNEDGKKSHIVYLPEVVNGTSEADYLNIEVELTAKDPEGNLTESVETGNFDVMDYSDVDNPTAIDIVRNHWYKYTVSGFAAGEVQVNYQTLDWQDVGIEIGGEGFLFLNKDVIEIYNSNIDADQLKFSSSSPIKSIELKDIYTHERNGSFTEGTEDGVYAYYMDKFGDLKQLPSKDDTANPESIILANTSAVVDGEDLNVLNGNIKITSPFMPVEDETNTVLKEGSHYNTIRYLEFEVTNTQNLHATFRVMQYPPVVITNEEGYFSYRDDFRTSESGHYVNDDMFSEEIKDYGPIHYHNYHNPAWAFAGYYSYYIYECSPTGAPQTKLTTTYQWEETNYTSWKVAWHNTPNYPTLGNVYFHRDHYMWAEGYAPSTSEGHFLDISCSGIMATHKYYQGLGPLYVENGKNLRRHYTGNLMEFFVPKVVDRVFKNDEAIDVEESIRVQVCQTCTREASKINKDRKPYILSADCQSPGSHKGKWAYYNVKAEAPGSMSFKKGQAAIYLLTPNDDYTGWDYTSYLSVLGTPRWNYLGNGFDPLAETDRLKRPTYFNHRMYTIRTSVASNDYVIGYPELVDIDGNSTFDTDRGITADTEANARMVSPAFMVASQLGETDNPANEYHYQVLGPEAFLYYAKRQCQEYVETTYEDLNNNYKWDLNEPVKHYRGWRLPTEAELKLILKYQDESPAMDELLTGQNYFCAKPSPSYVTLDGKEGKEDGFYIRCVRDIRGDENVKIEK